MGDGLARVIEWAALVFALMRALRGDIQGVTLAFLVVIYAKQHQRGLGDERGD